MAESRRPQLPDDEEPLILTDLRPQPNGLNRKVIYGGLAGLVVLTFVLLLVLTSREANRQPVPAAAPPAQTTMAGVVPPIERFIKVPTDFENTDRRPKEEPPPHEPGLPKDPPGEKPHGEKPQEKTTQGKAKQETRQATTTRPPSKPRKQPWLFVPVAHFQRGTDPFAAGAPGTAAPEAGNGQAGNLVQGQQRGAGLLQPAKWERPAQPDLVLFRGQVIQGMLLQDYNSDIPGDIPVYINRPVWARTGNKSVLVPQHTKAILTQEGRPDFGEARVKANLEQLEFPGPTKELVTFKAVGADANGAVGLDGTVNNHYGRIGLSVLATTMLSIAPRVAFGSPTGFQPSLGQQFGQEMAQGVNQAGQDLVRRMFPTHPTIEGKAGDEVTIQVQQNVSFARQPPVVR